jgi:hypothetical protein
LNADLRLSLSASSGGITGPMDFAMAKERSFGFGGTEKNL